MHSFLEMQGICKSFPGVQALDDVNLSVKKGEVHALIGENGSGKSTLMKILSGAYQMDSGRILLNGNEIEIKSPHDAAQYGISTIYQELNLVEQLTVAENIFMGHQAEESFFHVDWKGLFSRSQQMLDELGINLDSHARISSLGIAYKQMVEIVKALSHEAQLIIMDEPTAPLTKHETDILFSLIRRLKEKGVSIIYISHRLEEILAVCDSITIIRDGKNVSVLDVKDATVDGIIRMMVGRTIEEQFPKTKVEIGKELLRVNNLSCNKVEDVNFYVRSGEILGITGLIGAGRTETMRALFGIDPVTCGEFFMDGRKITINKPSDAINAGIGFVTEDRKKEGVVLQLGVDKNITLASLDSYLSWQSINIKKEQYDSQKLVDSLNIITPSVRQKVINLSGGNQQKVVLAKWLLSNVKVLILDEPTRGIDVNAKVEVYNIINKLVEKGVGVILISSEIEEVMGLADRILVMSQGRVVFEGRNDETLTQELIMTYATGNRVE